MSLLLQQERYDRKIRFFRERLQTCGYRFYKMLQTRKKEIPKIADNPSPQTFDDVEKKLLFEANTYINCLVGEHYSQEIPSYLQDKANSFKSSFYTRLASKNILEQNRLDLLETIFTQYDK